MKTKTKLIIYGLIHTLVMTLCIVYTALQESILDAGYLFNYPWYWGTLVDTYLAFLCFYWWVAYCETKWVSRVVWFFAIVFLGNMAMGLYIVLRAQSLADDATMVDFLTKRKT